MYPTNLAWKRYKDLYRNVTFTVLKKFLSMKCYPTRQKTLVIAGLQRGRYMGYEKGYFMYSFKLRWPGWPRSISWVIITLTMVVWLPIPKGEFCWTPPYSSRSQLLVKLHSRHPFLPFISTFSTLLTFYNTDRLCMTDVVRPFLDMLSHK